MPRRTNLKTLERQIEVLQKKADQLKKKEKGPALKQIISLMRENGIELSDIQAAAGGRKGRRGRPPGKAKSASLRGRKVKPMYRNPKTGETWSGRGRVARWLAAFEKNGRKRAEFLIKS